MRKGIWQEFDGYQDIVEEIKVSRKLGGTVSSAMVSAEEYIRQLHPDRLELCVSDIITETPSTKTLRLVSKDNYLPPFMAGQYIALYLEIAGIRTSRPYSISSQPNQVGYYDITVRRVENGLVSNYLLDVVKRGDTLISSGPAGNFYFNPLLHKKTMVCIAGGSGITPFMSMIREIIECALDRLVYLFYGNQTIDDVIFGAELNRISKRFDHIHYIPVIEEPSRKYEGACGFISRDVMREVLENIEDKSFFICGPQGLYDFCLPQIQEMGVPGRKIKQEMYGAPPNIWQYPGWPHEVHQDDVFTVNIKNGKQLTAKAGEPLLVALEKNGVVVPSLCRSGDCSMCRLKILSGKVFQPAGVPVRKSDKKYGYVHSCVSYPLENLEILIQ
ncbi:MAG: 2Fe-2S iron-sulfur cluster binding domain-containing protein [Deltaproteobacteria bacterium]|nr:MAG: 2Fe-2S iron-sulfur cluster binding domain-containing protein [Deltaproteobacteria bacterium]